jgi:hypothetical protein
MTETDGNTTRHRFLTDPFGRLQYEKLGRFIFQYANAETMFHMAFRHYSQMPIVEARMLFGGRSARNIEDIIDKTAKLIKLYKVADGLDKDFCSMRGQFKFVGLVRGKILHRGWRAYRGGFLVSDVATAQVHEKVDTLEVTSDQMDDMTEDLLRICMSISFRHIDPRASVELPSIDEPWRHKPVEGK